MANSEDEIGCCVGGRCSGLPYDGKRGWDASIPAIRSSTSSSSSCCRRDFSAVLLVRVSIYRISSLFSIKIKERRSSDDIEAYWY